MPQMEMLRLWLKDKIAVIVCNINGHMNSWSLAWQAAPEAWRHPRNPLSWIRQVGWRDNSRSSAQSDALCLAVGLYKMMIWYADCLVVFYPFKARKVIGNFGHTLMNLVIASVQSLQDVFFLVHGTQKSRTFCLTSQFGEKIRKGSHLCALLAVRPGHVFRGHLAPPEHPRKSAAKTYLDPSPPGGPSQMLKQFWLRWDQCCHGQGALVTTTGRAVEKTGFGWFGSESCWDTWSLWCLFFFENAVLSSIVFAVAGCAGLIDVVHAAVLASTLHGCECVWQSEVGNAAEFPMESFSLGQVGESNRAAAEFADDNVTWLHLVTIKNSGRSRMKQTDSLWMDYLRSATNLALKWADKRLTFFELGCCMGWMVGWLDCLRRCFAKAQSSEWIPGDLDPTFAKLRRWWSVCSVWLDSVLLTTRLLMQIIYMYQNVVIRDSEESTEGIEMTLIFIMTDEADSFAAKMGRSDALQSAISVFDNESCHWCRPFFASGVVCSKYTRRTRWDCKFWTRPSGGKNDDGICHARVISTQIHYIPGTTSPIHRWSTSQLKIVWKKHENMFRTKRHKLAWSLALEFLGVFDTSPAI